MIALIVVIVIDQLRTDELLRIRENLNPAGLGLLLNQGVFYDDAHHTNFFTKTCPGHVAISTGSQPGLSGISQNEEWDPKTKTRAYCVEDSAEHLLEADLDDKNVHTGKSSRRLMTSTMGDELKFIYKDDARVVSVAVKDRAAITLAGHTGDGVFWYAPKSHVWTSSTFFAKKLPAWLKDFNKKQGPTQNYMSTDQAILDTTEVALLAAKNLELGHHAKTDLLMISYSTHDIVGHAKGDDSKELVHTLSVEDKSIAELISNLRSSLGAKKIVVALTADHGVGIDHKAAQNLKIPAGQMDDTTLAKKINDCLGARGKVVSAHSMSLFLDPDTKDIVSLRRSTKECFAKQEGVWAAFTRDEILSNQIPQVSWLKNLQSSYFPSRGPDVVGVLMPYWNSDQEDLISHETPYDYDSWVPLAFWWNGIQKKMVHKRAEVTQLAPTFARLMNTRRPSGASGDYLEDLLIQLEPSKAKSERLHIAAKINGERPFDLQPVQN